jgi:endonuclease I
MMYVRKKEKEEMNEWKKERNRTILCIQFGNRNILVKALGAYVFTNVS